MVNDEEQSENFPHNICKIRKKSLILHPEFVKNNKYKIKYRYEKNISASQPSPQQQARFSSENDYRQWSSRIGLSSR